MKKLKRILSNLEYNYGWLRVINSPFVLLKLKFKWYKELTAGTPYFLPRKWVKFSKKDCLHKYKEECEEFRAIGQEIPRSLTPETYKNYLKPVTIKYFGINYWSLGWKTKWSNTDVRFECGPGLSIVLFETQIVIYPIPNCDSNAISEYWESFLVYHKHTDKSKSVEERLKQCMKIHPAVWIKNNNEIINYYNFILKDKYKYLVNEKSKFKG